MKKYDNLKDRLKQLDEEIPAAYPLAIIVDESRNETIAGKMKEYNIPEKNEVVWIIDNI